MEFTKDNNILELLPNNIIIKGSKSFTEELN